MSNPRPREVLNAVHSVKEKGPPVADGTLSVTADASEATEFCSRRSALDFVATTSTYLEDDSDGAKPGDLYGKVTWKIERFSETSKRELRSNVFEVGQYKWYILVYPHGCDVCNHLSLFLCVADYDKLLPGWSHFAQFTIAVVNKDPKKSKYSDTLHRFCKKEHDWGWKKFMELTKVLDGFAVNDTLVIKAQVQVIKDHVDRPFRCLDPHYRQELVRVYLSNVEGVCRRFIEQRREGLSSLKDHAEEFRAFWTSLSREKKKNIVVETEDVILKGLVKRFFNEKEVTSTLVMDAIFCGCKQIEEKSRRWLEGSRNRGDNPEVIVNSKNGLFVLGGDVLSVVESASTENVGASGKDDKEADAATNRSSQCDESIKDSIIRDEHRLAELGRQTVEMYVLSHIFNEHIEIAYQEAESLKRQEELLREEEEAAKRELQRKRTKAQNEKEKRAKRNERKKEKKEAERKRKEKEEAERRRLEQEKKKEAERKRIEEQEQRRLLEERLEREHQQALEEARLRAERRDREEAEKKEEEQRLQQAAVSPQNKDPSVDAGTTYQGRTLHSENKNASPMAETVERTLSSISSSGDPQSTRVIPAKPLPPCSSVSVDPPVAVTPKQKDEIQRLHAKIHSLEKQLIERDAHVIRLQQQIDTLKREKELEVEEEEVVAPRSPAPQTGKSPSVRTMDNVESPSKSWSNLTKNEGRRGTRGGMEHTCGSMFGNAHPEINASVSAQSTASFKAVNKSDVQESVLHHHHHHHEVGTHEGRSHSSGDETCSDTTFVDHCRCTSQIFNSADHSQVSDCTTHETRSLSSFGTQLDHNGHDFDGGMLHDAHRYGSRGYEAANVCGGDLPKPASAAALTNAYPMHVHSHSIALTTHHTHPPVSQIYAPAEPNTSRANSVASCIPTRQQQHHHHHTNGPPPMYSGSSLVGRSYSLDASMRLVDNGSYPNCPGYNEFAVMHDAFGLLYGAMPQGMPSPEAPIQPSNMLRMCDGVRVNECSSLDDFAHFSIIKDLLD